MGTSIHGSSASGRQHATASRAPAVAIRTVVLLAEMAATLDAISGGPGFSQIVLITHDRASVETLELFAAQVRRSLPSSWARLLVRRHQAGFRNPPVMESLFPVDQDPRLVGSCSVGPSPKRDRRTSRQRDLAIHSGPPFPAHRWKLGGHRRTEQSA
jgi:hypothetical protein